MYNLVNVKTRIIKGAVAKFLKPSYNLEKINKGITNVIL